MLVKIDAGAGKARILPLLDSPDPAVRWLVCGLLSRHGDGQSVGSLLRVLRADRDAGVRSLAAFALGNIGHRGRSPIYAGPSSMIEGLTLKAGR
jgi:hypothetical protein